MISWQELVDTSLLGSSCITNAAILQWDGATLSATQGFAVSASEVAAILSGMQDSSSFYLSGVRVNGIRYVFLHGTANTVSAKKETTGVYIHKTNKVLTVCTFEEPIKQNQAASVVDSVAEYLRNEGY